MGEIEIGYTVEKERWLAASENLHEFGQIMARNLRNMNRDGRGQEDADDLMGTLCWHVRPSDMWRSLPWINAGLFLCREVARSDRAEKATAM